MKYLVEISISNFLYFYVATLGKRYYWSMDYSNGLNGHTRCYNYNHNWCSGSYSRFLGRVARRIVRHLYLVKNKRPFRSFVFYNTSSEKIVAMPDKDIMTTVIHPIDANEKLFLYFPMTFLSLLIRITKNKIIGAIIPFDTAA